MPRTMTPLALVVLLTAVAGPGPAVARDGEDSFLESFAAGDYVLVGKAPDNGASFAGTARLSVTESGLVLERRIGGEVQTASGSAEVPHPPGEGRVLRFRWKDGDGANILSCLVGSDLDNYARLTCVRVIEGRDHVEPGLEALFPTAAWPESAPSKHFAEDPAAAP